MTTQKSKEEILAEMDSAADDAENELAELDQDAVSIVAGWWKKWYMKAGHKRLGRIIVQVTKGGGG